MTGSPRRALIAAVLAMAVAGCGGSSPGTAPSTSSATSPAPGTGATSSATSPAPRTGALPSTAAPGSAVPGASVPRFAHVYLLVLENKSYDEIVGNSSAPYLNQLIAKYGLATSYFAVAHPSQPNYLALFSGSTQGVTDDGIHHLAARNLADQLGAAGRTWRIYAQGYPGGCFDGAASSGGPEGFGVAGDYARKHVPALSFADITSNPARCANVTNLAGFDPAAASFEMIVPNTCNDMHSCAVSTGDAFAAAFVPRIISSPAFADGVLFITTDEGTTDTRGGGRVATVVVSPLVRAGFTSTVEHDHYSLLRTIQDAWGLGCLADTCRANDLAEFFT